MCVPLLLPHIASAAGCGTTEREVGQEDDNAGGTKEELRQFKFQYMLLMLESFQYMLHKRQPVLLSKENN